MNLSPAWVEVLAAHDIEAVHWMTVGERSANDHTIVAYAAEHGWTVLTHDLDFGSILAASGADGPSVLQVRARDIRPAVLLPFILAAVETFADALAAGAIVSIDEERQRARVLPIHPPS